MEMDNVVNVDGQHGCVALVDEMRMAPTRKAVNMARGSLGKWVPKTQDLSSKDYQLIDRLYEEHHTSPLRHSYVTFFIQCPFFVKNHFIKHQVGGTMTFVDSPWNEISGRYITYDKFWVPDELHKKGLISKSGGSDEVHPDSDALIADFKDAQERALATYRRMIDAGVAREEARTVLGMYVYTSFFVTGSLQYWAHLVKLRTAPDAQRQTRAYAVEIAKLCDDYYGYVWKEMVG